MRITINVDRSLLRTRDVGFDESKHKRAENGQFGSGGGSSSFEQSGEKWERGSGKVPKGSVWIDTPIPEVPRESNPINVLTPLRNDPFHKVGKAAAPVQEFKLSELTSWQNGVDPGKIRPVTGDVPPIWVGKVDGHLVIMDGNHRAASAFVQGDETIKAKYVDFDAPENRKYRKKKR